MWRFGIIVAFSMSVLAAPSSSPVSGPPIVCPDCGAFACDLEVTGDVGTAMGTLEQDEGVVPYMEAGWEDVELELEQDGQVWWIELTSADLRLVEEIELPAELDPSGIFKVRVTLFNESAYSTQEECGSPE